MGSWTFVVVACLTLGGDGCGVACASFELGSVRSKDQAHETYVMDRRGK